MELNLVVEVLSVLSQLKPRSLASKWTYKLALWEGIMELHLVFAREGIKLETRNKRGKVENGAAYSSLGHLVGMP